MQDFSNAFNGAFTLPENEIETDTGNKYTYTELYVDQCCHQSLCSMMQSYTTHYLSVSISSWVSASVNTP